ncbi:Gfo/Idh/MocA family oxidoreductase [Actinophytocola sp.]|uniref:Gfo/Idh/MocA family protein n=1 Tax=Actinophytocola sp. TaxID=1872138 RepID=UPI002D802DBC|nr:Gfo/Idh/MocA family oxidoreductase [Actinophytocola sp.]HET9141549.1 Gfo/Idh/MocA family oxidoreductase [Actinophytocola sp.]
MRTFEVAVVGTGGIASVQAEGLRKLDGRARIVAVADVDTERLTAFADTWSVTRRYTELDTLLDNESPDVIHLCTPPWLHREQAVRCLSRGHTVLCEKPPALSLAELAAIGSAEASGGGRFATVFQHRFGGGARSARRLVGDARLGRPLTAVCNTLWLRTDDYFAVPWRGRWETEGGGPTMGHGIHQFDLLLWLLGPWRQVVAVASRMARATATEDLSCAIVTFDNGAVATVVNSLLSPRQTSYLRLDFEHATVELEHLYHYGDSNWTVTPAPGHEEAVTGAWAEGLTGRPSGHAAQFAAVFDALESGAPPPVTIADTRATMELAAAIYASSFTGAPVTRGDIGPASPFYSRMDGTGAPWGPQPVGGRA